MARRGAFVTRARGHVAFSFFGERQGMWMPPGRPHGILTSASDLAPSLRVEQSTRPLPADTKWRSGARHAAGGYHGLPAALVPCGLANP